MYFGGISYRGPACNLNGTKALQDVSHVITILLRYSSITGGGLIRLGSKQERDLIRSGPQPTWRDKHATSTPANAHPLDIGSLIHIYGVSQTSCYFFRFLDRLISINERPRIVVFFLTR